jgi:hypothetical protein
LSNAACGALIAAVDGVGVPCSRASIAFTSVCCQRLMPGTA